jgi:hypothetical protein
MIKSQLLSIVLILSLLAACKKNDTAPVTSQTLIAGKWYVTSHTFNVYSQNKLIDTATRTAFTTDDFIEYDSDGTGYTSTEASPSPSIKLFKYSISALNLVEVDLTGSPGLPETITTLTANNLSYHYTITTTDDSGQQYIEADTYTFKR